MGRIWSARGDLVAGGDPCFRSVQFRLCVDLPIAPVANYLTGRPSPLVPVCVRSFSSADYASLGIDRCCPSCLDWAVVSAQNFTHCSSGAAVWCRPSRQDAGRRHAHVWCYIVIGLGRPSVERAARVLPASRDNPLSVVASRATMKLLTTRYGLPQLSWGAVTAGVILSMIVYLIMSVLGTAIGACSSRLWRRQTPCAAPDLARVFG
jgi:hypothetical protein